MSDGFNGILHDWAAACSQCLGSVYDICRPFHEPECRALHPNVRFIIAQLNISCHLTSESAFILVSNRKIWDADILIRSVLEGTLKFVYMLQGSDIDQQNKCCEYWETLPDFAILTRQKRAAALLEQLPDSESPEWEPIRKLLISNTELEEISRTANRKERQRLARKWSFSELSRFFTTHNDKKYHGLGFLGYNYGMQSHLVHQDGDGVGMLWERARREDERRDSIEMAHGGRVISDLCTFAFVRAHELLIICQEEPKPIQEIEKSYKNLFNSIRAEQQRWREIEYE
jgi:hypothetical protein